MRLVVTGGGTGGHVYPALEVAREARDQRWDVQYFGSLRGQELKLSREFGFVFAGFPSEPLYSIRTIRGMRAALNLIRSRQLAKRQLAEVAPDVIFSTGGYSSAPVVSAAKSLGIPYVIHEQNSIPGRTNRILARDAFAVATTFRSGAEHFAGTQVVRTGLPIRRELRESMQGKFDFSGKVSKDRPVIFVLGGSQGARALNEAAIATATRMAGSGSHWIVSAGTKNYEGMQASLQKLAVASDIDVRAYLNAEEMCNAYFSASIVVCRSGGSLAEVAAFRKPSVLIPLPSSFADHQRANAQEFVEMGAAQMLPQADLAASTLEIRIRAWIQDPDAYKHAQTALAEWDIPDACIRVVKLISDAAK